MGQRSQIYIRYPYKDNDGRTKYGLIASYYQWNYAERMVSRARYTIEWIFEHLRHTDWFYRENEEKLRRYADINFDFQDIAMSTNLIDEYIDLEGKGFTYLLEDFPAGVFNSDNNDGRLFIDIKPDCVKYCFYGYEGIPNHAKLSDLESPMDADAYLNWDLDVENWRSQNEYMDIYTTEENVRAINDNPQVYLMTKQELLNFVNFDYSDTLNDYIEPGGTHFKQRS